MSSGVVTSNPQLYFCHQCNRTVQISPIPNTDLLCPTCNSGFIEEFNDDNNNNILPDPFTFFLSQLFPNPSVNTNPNDFDPFTYLNNLLAQQRASGIDYQFVVGDNGHGIGLGFPRASNFGDYFIGPGFEQLIQQLAENDPNRYGTPPAAKHAVKGLPTVEVDKDLMESECAVCKDEFELGVKVKKMPCNHLYHEDCIVPWLELHNSCPVCRFELPTDDPDYENRSGEGGSGSGSGSGGRRFTVNLPWLFGGLGSDDAGNQNRPEGN